MIYGPRLLKIPRKNFKRSTEKEHKETCERTKEVTFRQSKIIAT